jgi:hypothetical protein
VAESAVDNPADRGDHFALLKRPRQAPTEAVSAALILATGLSHGFVAQGGLFAGRRAGTELVRESEGRSSRLPKFSGTVRSVCPVASRKARMASNLAAAWMTADLRSGLRAAKRWATSELSQLGLSVIATAGSPSGWPLRASAMPTLGFFGLGFQVRRLRAKQAGHLSAALVARLNQGITRKRFALSVLEAGRKGYQPQRRSSAGLS